MKASSIVLRLVAALVLISIVVAGGYMAYRAGIAQGVIQAPEVAKAISQAAQSGQPAPVPPMYGYGYGYRQFYGPHFGFFPFFGCFGAFLFIFFVFGLLRFIFRPWGWGYHGHRGPWGRWEGGVPPMFDEWHKRAHGEVPTEEANKKE